MDDPSVKPIVIDLTGDDHEPKNPTLKEPAKVRRKRKSTGLVLDSQDQVPKKRKGDDGVPGKAARDHRRSETANLGPEHIVAAKAVVQPPASPIHDSVSGAGTQADRPPGDDSPSLYMLGAFVVEAPGMQPHRLVPKPAGNTGRLRAFRWNMTRKTTSGVSASRR